MKIKPLIVIVSLCFLSLCIFTGCEDFLAAKPNVSYAIPSKVSDLQALLDNASKMNNRDAGSGEISADDYNLTDEVWAGLSSDYFRKMYLWEEEDLFPPSNNEWNNLYQTVYLANNVLDELKNLQHLSDDPQYSNVKGQALVFRAKSFLQLAYIWSNAYDSQTSNQYLGIPLRLNANFNEASVRSTVEQTYGRIIADLKEAADLLPNRNITPHRPGKAAAYGYLARTFLFMRDYDNALLYSGLCLDIQNELLDYNDLNPEANYPFQKLNKEVIMESYIPSPGPLNPKRGNISPELLQLYEDGDLRKILFFRDNLDDTYSFKGSYEGGAVLFSGVAVDEIYLIRAEANVRLGNIAEALTGLNSLLRTRYDSSFTDLTITNDDLLLKRIIEERRKQLVMRGLRWPDIKRLNLEGNNIKLTRTINNSTVTLEPNDPRFALPLPSDIIELTGMEDNPR